MRKSSRGALLTAAILAIPLGAGGCGGKPTGGDPRQVAQPAGEVALRGPGPAGMPPPGPGPFGGPPRPGQLLPPFVRGRLALTPEQARQVDQLQEETDSKVQAILTEEQKQQLLELTRSPRPGGPGGFPPPPPGPPPGGIE